MWTRLSLRARLFLPLGIMFVTALLVGAVSLAFFVPTQLADETAPAARSARAVADALNGGLRLFAHTGQTLGACLQSFGTTEDIPVWRAGAHKPRHSVEMRTPPRPMTRWVAD